MKIMTKNMIAQKGEPGMVVTELNYKVELKCFLKKIFN